MATTTTTTKSKPNLLLFLPLLIFSSLLLLFLARANNANTNNVVNHDNIHRRHLQVAGDHCEGTLYPSLCVETVSAIPALTSASLPDVITHVIQRTTRQVRVSASNCTLVLRKKYRNLDSRQRLALTDCLELFDRTIEDLEAARADVTSTNTSSNRFNDLQTVLSAAITNQYTCLDGFAYESDGGSVRRYIERGVYHISRLVSNSLAMSKKLPKKKKKKDSTGVEVIRREAFEGYGEVTGGYPTWVSRKDRRLLQAAVNSTSFNLVVAKDGSGNFTTIGDAVAAAPNNSNSRFVIYIKAGGYFENVEVASNKPNLMFVGDGMGKTVVKASRNVVDGWTTFRSATVAVVGKGFIARDMTFENSAGPSKHQAVALRSGSDFSAFYRCSFVAYQDTLYVHSLRQFYRECDIYGTVDFIFGNAAVVLQSCNLYARKPDPNQKNIFTAQGREDPNQNTGISIQNCKVEAAADLIPVKSSFKTYLGRPWKMYSRTVVMRSNIGDLVDPAGWLEWNGTFALDTLYYGEYMNRGLGSNTTRRVTWPGYKVINSSDEAAQFTVGPFIQGDQWLPQTPVPYVSGLF